MDYEEYATIRLLVTESVLTLTQRGTTLGMG
jgi:hypothetical protein